MSGAPPSGPLVLAVDGGASKTDAWVVDGEGSLLGAAQGGGSNHQFSGIDGAVGTLGSTITSALRAAGLDPSDRPAADTGVFCMAGLDLPVDEERLGPAISGQEWCRRTLLHNDTVAVLRAGSRSGWGVAVVCGSGLNCVGLGPDGAVERFPSLAELSGDFAPGGSWLGVRALGLALRSRDGRGGPTSLGELVPAHFGLSDPLAVVTAVYTGTLDYGRLFELARVCLDAAAEGDRAAVAAAGILADEVVAMVVAIVDRLGLTGEIVEVVLGGGIFDSTYRGFGRRVESGVRDRVARAIFRRLEGAPVLGAALLGLDAVGAPAGAEERLRSAAARAGGRPPPGG
jgi:N-acetylglucosamine kinase-like BadF-type ATPase